MKEKVEKSMSGRYKDNSENRRLHRVGQEYHHGSQQGEDNDNERQIKALQSKIEQMKKNKHIFIEQGGEMKYNRALGVLQGKLNELQNSRKTTTVKMTEEQKDAKNNGREKKVSTSKKYAEMDIKEAEKELLGKDLTITDIETGKTRTEKIASILEGNVRGHETVMARVESGGTYPIKHIDTGKEWKAWKLSLASETKEPEKKEVIHDINGVKVKVTKNSNGSYTLEANGKKVKTDDPSYFVFGTDIKPRVKAALAKEVGIEKVPSSVKIDQKRETKSEQVKQVSSLKEDLNHHNNELDNLENKKEDYIKQHGEEKYNERHKKIEDKIEDIRKELDNLKGSDKTGGNEEKETFTRVKFDDVPNSGKVNLKKYLSGKRQKVVDERWGSISKITDADLKKMEQGLVNKFNESFESSSKAQRAEDLYHIMKVKGEIAKRSKKN